MNNTVREQYETLPYPVRDPADEKKRLICTWLTGLDTINHYCFKGKRDFTENFRALIAGGGTGDATIHLAEEFRGTNAEIIHLDFSKTSIEIAKERARVRGLSNITWIYNSLLELPNLKIGEFDYINCVGVLHHLDNPDAGLAALKSVLAPGGCMGLMLYGQYGRTGVYQIQQLMRIVNRGIISPESKLSSTRAMINSLPSTNWLIRDIDKWQSEINQGDPALYDLFLHSKDQAYTVPELYNLLERQQLHLISFIGLETCGDSYYRPERFIREPSLLDQVKKLPHKDQQAVAEIMAGCISSHTFFTSELKDTKCSTNDLMLIPMVSRSYRRSHGPDAFAQIIENTNPGENILLHKDKHVTVNIKMTPVQKKFLMRINGRDTTKSILDSILLNEMVAPSYDGGEASSLETLAKEIIPLLEDLIETMIVYLRHPDSPSL